MERVQSDREKDHAALGIGREQARSLSKALGHDKLLWKAGTTAVATGGEDDKVPLFDDASKAVQNANARRSILRLVASTPITAPSGSNSALRGNYQNYDIACAC